MTRGLSVTGYRVWLLCITVRILCGAVMLLVRLSGCFPFNVVEGIQGFLSATALVLSSSQIPTAPQNISKPFRIRAHFKNNNNNNKHRPTPPWTSAKLKRVFFTANLSRLGKSSCQSVHKDAWPGLHTRKRRGDGTIWRCDCRSLQIKADMQRPESCRVWHNHSFVFLISFTSPHRNRASLTHTQTHTRTKRNDQDILLSDYWKSRKARNTNRCRMSSRPLFLVWEGIKIK